MVLQYLLHKYFRWWNISLKFLCVYILFCCRWPRVIELCKLSVDEHLLWKNDRRFGKWKINDTKDHWQRNHFKHSNYFTTSENAAPLATHSQVSLHTADAPSTEATCSSKTTQDYNATPTQQHQSQQLQTESLKHRQKPLKTRLMHWNQSVLENNRR